MGLVQENRRKQRKLYQDVFKVQKPSVWTKSSETFNASPATAPCSTPVARAALSAVLQNNGDHLHFDSIARLCATCKGLLQVVSRMRFKLAMLQHAVQLLKEKGTLKRRLAPGLASKLLAACDTSLGGHRLSAPGRWRRWRS